MALSFDDVLRRLGRRDRVDGLIVIGSVAKDTLHAASDYDLYVVLSEPPVPLHVGLTWVDGRLTDLIFEHVALIDRFLARGDGLPVDAAEERLVRYVATGHIVLDRHNRLERVRGQQADAPPHDPWSESDRQSTWFSVNYNLAQTRRMLRSTDPVYTRAVDIRLLYSISDLLPAYYRLRSLPWRGEKEAVRDVSVKDPEFWQTFEEYLDATDRAGRMLAYERLAALTLAPVGGVWPQGVTAFELDGVRDAPLADARQALTFWDDLLTSL